MRKITVLIVVYALIAAIIIVGAFFCLNRPQLMIIGAEVATDFPADDFSHGDLSLLLEKYVDGEGYVGYDRWYLEKTDRHRLDQYLAAVGKFSPDNVPERFPRRSDALAYWLYSYNAHVIRSVLQHWPLDSVTDVKAPIEAVAELGFF